MTDFCLGAGYDVDPRAGVPDLRRDCAEIAGNGYGRVHADVRWDIIEPREGQTDLGAIERLLEAAASEGLAVVLRLLLDPPLWIRARAADTDDRWSVESAALQSTIPDLVGSLAAAPALAGWTIALPPQRRDRGLLESFAAGSADAVERWRRHPATAAVLGTDEDVDADWLDHLLTHGTAAQRLPVEHDLTAHLAEVTTERLAWLRDQIQAHDPGRPIAVEIDQTRGNPAEQGRDDARAAAVSGSVVAAVRRDTNPQVGDVTARRVHLRCGLDRAWSWAKESGTAVAELQAGTAEMVPEPYTPTPETITHELWEAYAAGLHGVVHDRWRGPRAGWQAEAGIRASADGAPTPRSWVVADVARRFDEHRSVLAAVWREPARVAILDSFADAVQRAGQQQAYPEITGLAERGRQAVLGCYRALSEASIQVDLVSDAEVAAGLDERYRVLFLPQVHLVGAPTAAGIAAFVDRGGAVWADGRLGWLDDGVVVRDGAPGHGLAEVFGVRQIDYSASTSVVSARIVGGAELRGQRLRQAFELAGGIRVHARYPDGAAAAVDAMSGRGHTRIWGMELTARIATESATAIAQEITGFALAHGAQKVLDLPTGVTARRLVGDGVSVIVIHNSTKRTIPVSIEIGDLSATSLYEPCQVDEAEASVSVRPEQTEVLVFSVVSPPDGEEPASEPTEAGDSDRS